VSRLDNMIARARDLQVRDDHADRFVAELGRWARPEPKPSRAPWFGFALAAAAAAVLLVLVLRPHGGATTAPGAIRIGERVAIIAEPNTSYRVLAADVDRTEVFVERGTVTARLWPGEQPHRLALRGEGVEAVATGTVYTLSVDERGPSVHVREGKVAVARGDERVQVAAGTSWPPGAARRDSHAAERLLAMTAPPPVAIDEPVRVPDPQPIDDTPPAPADAPPSDASPHPHGSPAAVPDAGVPAPSLKDRWRQARLLRGQGNFDAAIAECIAIADAKDATWSPIALVEAARIELGPRASPERAIALADRFAAEWPAHQLAPEARELRCRALRQLGRDAECNAEQ
jgi:hypothetical protein